MAAAQKTRILIFGTGAGGINFYKSCRSRYSVIGFVDNNRQKQGQTLFGKTIHGPHDLSELLFDQIIIASDYYREIHPQLVNELAICASRVSVFHRQLTVFGPFQRLKAHVERLSLAWMCHRPGWLSDGLFHLVFAGQPGTQRFALTWLDEAADYKVQVLRKAQPGGVQGPRYLGREVPKTPIVVPEVALYRFRDGEVCSVSRSVILPQGRLVVERVATAKNADADYSAAQLLYHGNALALARPATQPEHLDKGVLISGGSEVNYYHWVLEILSQLQFLDELPTAFADYPVLMSANSQSIAAIKALIEAIGINRPVVYLQSVASYQVADLLLISAPNNYITNFKGAAYSLANYSFARPEAIRFLRDKARPMAANVARQSLPKRVFLGRKGFLRPYNQAQILARLEPLGFVCVYMEEQDIQHQIAIMANADLIIGPTGAAWTNIIFASPGARALCWMAEEAGAVSCFSNLAAIVGVEMDYLPYQANTSASREIYYKGYAIDAEAIVNWLSQHVRTLPGGVSS